VRLRTDDRFRYEVVVVDNASTDATPEVVAAFTQHPAATVRGVVECQPGVSWARNRGLAEAHGEWIAFFDDDQEAAEDWLLQLWKTAEARGCRVVGGAVRLAGSPADHAHLGPLAQSMFGVTAGRDTEQPYTRTFAPGAGNLLVHRRVFDQVGAFDTTLADAGEDTDLYRRIRAAGLAAWYTPRAIVDHKIPAERLTRDHLLRTAARVGGHIARREQRGAGRAMLAVLLLARCVQSLVRDSRAWLFSRLSRDPARRLDADCLRARSEGYFRSGLRALCPALFGQQRFFDSLNFRADRQPAVR
jgi:GT2 family glycosyltransferase